MHSQSSVTIQVSSDSLKVSQSEQVHGLSEAGLSCIAQHWSSKSERSAYEEQYDGKKLSVRYAALVALRPKASMCAFCSSCLLFLAMIVLAMKTGTAIFFEINPPVYVEGHTTYEREDAVLQAKQDANAIPPFFLNRRGQPPAVETPRRTLVHKLKVMYEAPAGENIWDLKHLQTIADIESKIIRASGKNSKGETLKYTDYCQLVYNPATNALLNPESPCKTPTSAIAFLWSPWMPVPYNGEPEYGSPASNVMWVNPQGLTERNVKCPLLPLNPAALPKDMHSMQTIMSSFLPPDLNMEKLIQKFRDGQVCEVGKQIYANMTCDEFQVCFALLHNTLSMQTWALTNNSMWDYEAIDMYYERNFDSFLKYWSTYDSSGIKDGQLCNITQGAHQSVVYGAVGYRDGVGEVYAQTLPNMIRSVADASFGKPQGGKTGKAVMSTFFFGGPLNMIDSSWSSLGGDVLEQQNQDFTKWALDALNPLLMDAHNKQSHGLKVLWEVENVISGGKDPLYVAYMKSHIVPQDMRFLLAAFVFVFCFVAYQTRSLFLSSVALGMIVINIVPTLALYVLVFRQTYLGVLQILSLFLIMGIGVDNVFVLLECYHQNREHGRPFASDLSAAWHHAAKAMLCTSSTTCFSFLANATSSFPAVYTFGFWCCSLIMVNYCSVNTLYLAAVSVFDRHFARKKLCCGHAPCMKKLSSEADEAKANSSCTRTFFEHTFFHFVSSFRVPLVAVWVALFVVYAMCAMQLQPDPEAPKLLPDSDPYMQWTGALVEHFGAFNNPKLITVNLIFGIDRQTPLDRQGTNPADVTDRGRVNWSGLNASDAEWVQAQTWLSDLCLDLEQSSGSRSSGLKIGAQDISGQSPVKCFWTHLKQWAIQNEHTWPVPSFSELQVVMSAFLRSADLQNPRDTNYDRWSRNMFFTSDSSQPYGVTPQFFSIDVKLSAQADILYKDGLDIWEAWEEYCNRWRASAPEFLQRGFYFTDIRKGSGAFGWFILQSKITNEAFIGMAMAMGFASIVLLLATRNIVVASSAILSICSIVCSVMALMYCIGWKLGVIEALVLVMVIGLSVDYVVHMADAYLEAPAEDRFGRTKFMLVRMGFAVINGGITTIGAAALMCACYITFFQKFGIVILATVFQALVQALVFFSAMMALFGPQGTSGNISLGLCFEKFCSNQQDSQTPHSKTPKEVATAHQIV